MPRAVATLILVCLSALAVAGERGKAGVASVFHFEVEPIVTGDDAQAEALRRAVVDFWQDYLRMNAPGHAARFAPDAIRLSARAAERQSGRAAVQAGLASEWEAFERPGGRIAEQMTVERAEFHFDGESAMAIYWIQVEGGARWEYSDQGLVFQAWVLKDGRWLVAHHTDTWSLDYDVESGEPGAGDAVEFEFAYPVRDLARAVKFYTPLLGAPESATATRAVFNLKGARFVLDTATWGGRARVRKDLPNGYALFVLPDAQAVAERVAEEGEIGTPQVIGGDSYRTGFDADENLFVLREPDFHSESGPAPTISGFPAGNPAAQAAQRIMQQWLWMDSDALGALQAAHSTWFDDTRLKHRGQERGARRVASALDEVYWPRYDQSEEGMAAQLKASQVEVRPIGSLAIVSYDMRLAGVGPHPFTDSAWVTQVFDQRKRLLHSFMVDNHRSRAPVLELDYTGYPVQDLAEARRFYREAVGFDEGYPDEDYYGYWSHHAVFGLYLADPEEDGVPQPRQANGYMSFWVRSASEIAAYLRQQGRNFPTIPAINDVAGIDVQPGYAQVVSTDSEGNLIIFTEYSGRPR